MGVAPSVIINQTFGSFFGLVGNPNLVVFVQFQNSSSVQRNVTTMSFAILK